VIVAARDSGGTTPISLREIQTQLLSLDAELIVVAPAGSREATLAAGSGRLITLPGDPLVPDLWRAGLVASEADLVVFTIAQCVPEPGWLVALVSALDAGASAAGGPVRLGSRRPEVAAVYFLRYSPYFLPFATHDSGEVPGDNAIYRRSAIDRVAGSWSHGFWENEVNAALRRRGERLVMDPRPVVRLRTGGGVGAFCRQRYRHGKVFGAWRRSSGAGQWRALLAPLVPLVFLARIARRVRPNERGALVASLPFLLLYLVCWTAGETAGLLR
jgi:hypothetical protein